MKTLTTIYLSQWSRSFGTMLMVALMMSAVAYSQPYSNPSAVDLLTAGNYRALAGTGLVIGASCTVTGNVGGSTVTNSGTVTGTTDVANATWTTATNDLNSVFAELLSRPVDFTFVTVDIGGMELGRGVYQANASGTLGITGTLTLTGTETDIFIIRTGTSGTPGTSLITSASSTVVMGGTAKASNVYWVIGTSTALGGSSTFYGNILAGTTILQNADVSFEGRALGKTTVTLNGLSVLPVELVSFTASADNMNANLRWLTATEVNNYGFTVERKTTDNWNRIGFVEGSGTSNSPKEYLFFDKNITPGTYSYRLKQIDRDGKFSYSGSVEVTIGHAPMEFGLMQNYPNPFNPTTTIEYSIDRTSPVTLKVYDLIGNEVATLVNMRQNAGTYIVPFNINEGIYDYPTGVYFYRLKAGSNVSTKRLILMK